MSKKKIELLSPAGDMLSLKGAVNNGCDAVYLGGKNFNARSSASNFTDSEIEEAVEYCELRGVKVFLVVNILYKEVELESLYKFLNKMYEAGVDSFIVQDIGVGMFIKNNFRKVKVHASTQLNAHSLKDVLYLQSLGFDRVILAREVPLKEIKLIKEKVNIEIEIFAHGALCISHSGQCLMSSFIGDRSGNRGKCAGTCRLNFDFTNSDGEVIKSGHLLSAKDLMTLDIMKELHDIGIDSIKLEGRMKNYEYVSLVTKLYREQINCLRGLKDEDKKQITQIFNRGGELSSGFLKENFEDLMSIETPKSTGLCIGYVRHYSRAQNICTIKLEDKVVAGDGIEVWTEEKPHVGCGINKGGERGEDITVVLKGNIKKDDKVYKSYDKELNDILKNSYKGNRQQEVECKVEGKIGETLKVVAIFMDKEIEVVSESKVDVAVNSPLEVEKILEKLGKTGNTPFKFNFISVEIDENIYFSIKELNNLKRELVEKLEREIMDNLKREPVDVKYKEIDNEYVDEKYITVQISSYDKVDDVVSSGVHRIYFEYYKGMEKGLEDSVRKSKKAGIEFFISLPKISTTRVEDELEKFIEGIEERGIMVDGFCIATYGQKYLVPKKYKICHDYNFNVYNNLSNKFLNKKENKFTVNLSVELSIEELRKISNKHTEVVIHGKLPMMINRQCPVGSYVGDKKGKHCKVKGHKDNYYLVDRKEEKFLVKCYCDDCYVHIMQNEYLFTLNKFDDVRSLKSKYFKIVITDETDIEELIMCYKNILENRRDDNHKKVVEKYKGLGITFGHMYKGVL